MYKKNHITNTSIEVNKSDVGITIEKRIELMMNNKEPITDGAPLQYTERKDGVKPEFNPRTDRFEIAADAMDIANKQKLAKRNPPMIVVKENAENGQSPETGVNSTTSN